MRKSWALNLMRIGIDVQPLQTGTRYAGVGCYLRNVLQHLSSVDTENEYVLLLNNSDYLATVQPPSGQWQTYPVARKHRLGRFSWCWDTVYLPLVLHKQHIDIYHYHSLSEFEPLAPPFPFGRHRVIATIYDLIPLKFPNQSAAYFSAAWGSFDYAAKLRRLMSADAIITLTESSKQDIIELLHYPADRIMIMSGGISNIFAHDATCEHLNRFKSKYALPEYFILYLGGYYSPRKNLARLLEAYKILLGSDLSPKPFLVLAGLDNPVHQKQVALLLAENQLTQQIVCLPHIPHEALELPLLYRSAALFVYPSLYEGFGLPVAEALACGTVTATSNCSSLPEVGGDACLYFDPYDVQAIAEMMYTGLTNPVIRRELQGKGPQRAKLFSWQRTAQIVLSVYQDIHT